MIKPEEFYDFRNGKKVKALIEATRFNRLTFGYFFLRLLCVFSNLNFLKR